MPSIRAIMVYPRQVLLFAGGDAVRTINVARPVTTLDMLVSTVGKPGWIARTGPGQVTARAAIVVQAPASFTVGPPTKELVLQDRKGVFLAAYGGRKSGRARLTIRNVTVRASDDQVPRGGSRGVRRHDLGRPFVYANHSSLRISRCAFRWLGRDWNGSYGVAWSNGSSGYAVHSLFEDNFIGAYSDRARGLSIRDNVFRRNTLYGIDPHSYSTDLAIERNVSEENGRHGIIFSDHVTNSVVRDNVARHNSLNGIMMDEASTGNTIEGNVVEHNRSDGIVLADSGSNTVRHNMIQANRIGVHVRGDTSVNEVVRDNTIAGNVVAAQGIRLQNNRLANNGGQWKRLVLMRLWSAAAGTAMALCLLTALSRRKRDRLGAPAYRRSVAG
jgi:poly(beta-D-mannuronate) C5 epimerase